jgi:hypothetical protein
MHTKGQPARQPTWTSCMRWVLSALAGASSIVAPSQVRPSFGGALPRGGGGGGCVCGQGTVRQVRELRCKGSSLSQTHPHKSGLNPTTFRIFTHKHAHMHMCAYAHVPPPTDTHAYTNAHTRAQAHTLTHIHMRDLRARKHLCVRTRTHARTQMKTHKPNNMMHNHQHTHKYTSTHAQTR